MKHYMYVFIVFLWACSAAQPPSGTEQLTIGSWNVQNLFDGADNGFEYDESKNSEGWNSEKYHARLLGISEALKGNFEPDILVLFEVENENVIRDLAENCGDSYLWTFFAGAPESPIGFGVLSKIPLIETRTHTIHFPDGSIPRPVAEVWADTGSGPLVILACHWKSKSGGERKTEALRRLGAALVVRRLEEIAAENPEIPVIVAGDLNENHDEFTRIEAAYLSALLPDTGEAAKMVPKAQRSPRPGFQDFLVLSGLKPPQAEFFPGTGGVVYSPWLENEDELQGSYYYKGSLETIDHFLLNAAVFNRQGWYYENFRVLAEPPFSNDAGHPRPYNLRTGNGLSDHLPIMLILSRVQP